MTQKLRRRILELETISMDLEPSELTRNEYLIHIQDFANRFINGMGSAKVYSHEKVNDESLLIDGNKKTLKRVIDIYAKEVAGKGITAASGGHLGYIPGGGLFTSALADFLADITNEYAGLYYASPGAVTIEKKVLDWMKTVFGFPFSATGSLTSGGSVANLIALTAARDHHNIKPEKIRYSVIYLSRQTHHSVQKALKIIGLEEVIIRYTDLDENFRIEPGRLRKQIEDDIASGLNPFLVIATAGTTDIGAIDPLRDIGEISRAYKLWYHVDAAYGGFFILTKQKKELFRGIELADSLVTDPHKGLFMPSGAGAVLIRNREAVFHSFQYTANYMQDSVLSGQEVYNPADVSPELTRHFRALRVWLPLQVHGIEPFIACLEEKLLLTEYFRNRLNEKGFMTGPVPDLTISYFWYPAEKTDQDSCNRRLLELILQDGHVFFSSTIINGKFVIRMAVLSFRTRLGTIDKAIEVIQDARIKLDKELSIQ